MSFLGLMTVRAHEVVVREWDLRCVEARDERDSETVRANKLAAELAHWKQHAQLRDPKTGRLIPKVKAVDTLVDPLVDTYDTARDTRRDDRGVHGL